MVAMRDTVTITVTSPSMSMRPKLSLSLPTTAAAAAAASGPGVGVGGDGNVNAHVTTTTTTTSWNHHNHNYSHASYYRSSQNSAGGPHRHTSTPARTPTPSTHHPNDRTCSPMPIISPSPPPTTTTSRSLTTMLENVSITPPQSPHLDYEMGQPGLWYPSLLQQPIHPHPPTSTSTSAPQVTPARARTTNSYPCDPNPTWAMPQRRQVQPWKYNDDGDDDDDDDDELSGIFKSVRSAASAVRWRKDSRVAVPTVPMFKVGSMRERERDRGRDRGRDGGERMRVEAMPTQAGRGQMRRGRRKAIIAIPNLEEILERCTPVGSAGRGGSTMSTTSAAATATAGHGISQPGSRGHCYHHEHHPDTPYPMKEGDEGRRLPTPPTTPVS